MTQLQDYSKPWLSYEDQLALLESKGMNIGDREKALSYLERVGYYRLSAYWHPFRKANSKTELSDAFHENTHFTDAVDLYLFDKQLRLLMVDALERIEVAVKVDIAHSLGRIDPFAYRNLNFLDSKVALKQKSTQANKTTFQFWQERYQASRRTSKEDFVKHFKLKYNGDLPIWVAVEIWDFGSLSNFFAMMKGQDQFKIAKKYGIPQFQILVSWLRCINYLRNIVAHHSRLWNRNMADQPRLPKGNHPEWWQHFKNDQTLASKPFLLIAIVRHMMLGICPNTEWHLRISEHILNFPKIESSMKRSIEDMGIPENWEEWWK